MKKFEKINLAQIPTPIETISFEKKKFLIKRDDLTGCELSGNKVRKLEYILFEAKKKKVDIIFTCGGEQSNHARAVTIAAKKIGLKTKLFLWGNPKKNISGNLFLNLVNNSEIKFLNKKEYKNVNEIMFNEVRMFQEKRELNAYVIPEGGANVLGCYAYFNFVNEIANQIDLKKLDGIVVAAGSGGTAAGILSAISSLNLKLKLVAVNVLYNKETITKKILLLSEALLNEINSNSIVSSDKLIVLDGYSTEGYKKINKDKIELMLRFVEETGILFDPAYTGKAFYAYYENFLNKGLGMKYLFVHTGGLFGIFGREKDYLSGK